MDYESVRDWLEQEGRRVALKFNVGYGVSFSFHDCLHTQFYNDPIMAYMFKYDSIHGVFKGTLKVVDESTLVINEKRLNFLAKGTRLRSLRAIMGLSILLNLLGSSKQPDKASLT
ncbi:hypothetical protein Patl1_23818 [Pistacia atlantica]|uniref:Uncharacterized protein n=1 Tax=Pistacia atlantica TaxID=434234 RepID=A0ACC0ZYJ8_9ROSI|nr:hypothetical protein Patl1_23818 [Pistacia atlantica]